MTLIDRLSKLDVACDSVQSHKLADQMLEEYPEFGGHEWALFARSLRGSVDAAIALAERVLPDYDFIIGKTNGGLTIHAQVGPNEMEFGATPAIALCVAILRAKEASHGE